MIKISGMLIYFMLFILLPTLLFLLEWYLCKKQSKFAIILPVIVACFFVLLGFLAIGVAGIMFLIYFVMKHTENEYQKKLSEIDKMNIEDL